MTKNKQQFNTYLSSDLILTIKHRAIDDQLSLSDWMENAVLKYLESKFNSDKKSGARKKMYNAQNTNMKLQIMPLIHTENLNKSVEFFKKLGFEMLYQSRDGDWGQMKLNDCEIGLLAHPPSDDDERIELTFMSETPLTELEKVLQNSGVKILMSASDEGFGEQLKIEDADGHSIKINRLTPETFA